MQAEERTEFLSKALGSNIDSFNRKRQNNKTKAFLFKMSITALGGATTVLLGLEDVSDPTLFKNAALVCSALITLLSTFDAFFNHRALWVRYTQTYTELLAIQSDLNYALAGGPGTLQTDEIDALYRRFSLAMRRTNEWWQDTRRDESDAPAT